MPSKGRNLAGLLGGAGGGIPTESIADDAVTGDKIIDNVELQGTHIKLPVGDSATRPGSPTTGMLRYNTDTGVFEQYNAAGWQGIDSPPVVAGYSGIINENTDSTITITGSNFKQGSYVVIEGAGAPGGSKQLSTSFINTTTLTASTGATSQNYNAGQAFNIKVVNPTGLTATLENASTIDSDPVWVTSSGSLGTIYNGVSSTKSVSASDPDGGTITYSFNTTPIGMSASGGSLTGTPNGYASAYNTFPFNAADSSTTIPFIVTATSNGQEITRSFSVTAIDPYNPLNIIENYYASPDIAGNSSGTFPNLFFDDECNGGGLVHGAGSNAAADNWYIFHFTVPIRVNQVRVKGRNHTAQYLGNWAFDYNASAVTSYNSAGWNTACSASSYEPGTCTMGSWVSSSYSGYSKYWMFRMWGNSRGAYQSHAGMHIDYTVQA